MADPPGTLRVLMHSLAFGALKPLVGAEEVVSRHQLELTADVMGNSLVYWVQECLWAGLLDRGARIFAMTSIGSSRAVPRYGPVSAAKATLEAHIRQLAVELAPAGITANAILAGVTDTNALRQIPGYEKIMEAARRRNPQMCIRDSTNKMPNEPNIGLTRKKPNHFLSQARTRFRPRRQSACPRPTKYRTKPLLAEPQETKPLPLPDANPFPATPLPHQLQ